MRVPEATRWPSRRLLITATVGTAVALALPTGAGAAGEPTAKVFEPTVAQAAAAVSGEAAQRKGSRKTKSRVRGGKVRLAWPRDKSEKAPSFPLAEWLARQVGPDRDGATKEDGATETTPVLTFTGGITSGKLQLIRSFDIPTSDSNYERLANLSWTYDNALAVIAFIDADAKTQAEQLLDQLMALQRTDGSLDFAYDASSGEGSAQIRSGALAWVGIAATYYRRTYGSTRYDALIAGVASYLLTLRTSAGLIEGGPDVSWVSTQHNLLTVGFLRDLMYSLWSKPAESSLGMDAGAFNKAQDTMGEAILANLMVQKGSYAYFIEGVKDTRIPIDVQSLGAMFLKLRGDERASEVGAYLAGNFTATARSALDSIVFGFKPFNASASPDVVWSEGTIQAGVALGRLGASTTYADHALASLAALTRDYTVAPPQADQDATKDTSWGEYHTWPASAAASWLVMRTAGEGDQLFTR
jgi:hypothetical protein